MTQPLKLFVTGIDTGIGKTVTSAILTHYFKADYWKPIQSGDLHESDSMKIQQWNEHVTIHRERFRLQLPASPHESAAKENVNMQLSDFTLPDTVNNLIVEGAGGLFVPVNSSTYMIDLIQHLKIPVALVTKNYLGCINHTMLSIEALRTRNIPIDYLVLNGAFNPYSLEAIKNFIDRDTQLIHIPALEEITKEAVMLTALELASVSSQK
ncbi:dethiobiotin synthase [Myroides odoratimimus]|uniref:ATP-dependent dethiobiotin synthetase BioD n=1 Tax=Myroides odoratimimus CCUG 10230 TaxID=883150 RepID=A0ABP2NBZ4_9FLAO|nr:dethiobiotin synthase [Myroides odoratimimus]EHO10294.1 dethiobiotin synthase [Myroides odoratimimus CCUG 10230]MCO7724818.1 dethiobiotin synthase [Myroides odoratimimus]MDM1067335.1 dethiobiotin synthase [Myroides odoratimimus]MDM1086102.1 dethiobiotin synthase [Myroides odoratimimus]MDM1414254.1 dethiobiotin synthase [Myroides odoratimimus]